MPNPASLRRNGYAKAQKDGAVAERWVVGAVVENGRQIAYHCRYGFAQDSETDCDNERGGHRARRDFTRADRYREAGDADA